MSTFEFLSQLKAKDVRVWAEGDRLRCNAPNNVLTAELQAELRNRKAEILAFLNAAQSWSESITPLTPIQPFGANRRVFGIAGHNGDIFCYVPLSRHLGVERPIYGLQPPGVDGIGAPLTVVEDLASLFVRTIIAFQPTGPYLVSGYCLGGIIAFEVAQQLRQHGKEIGLLALFGSMCPTAFSRTHQTRIKIEAMMRKMKQQRMMLSSQSPLHWPAYLRSRAAVRREEDLKEKQREAEHPYRRKVEEATVQAVRQYKPQMYPGRVALFIPSDNPLYLFGDRFLDWQKFCSQPMDVYTGPSSCDGDVMLREPHVQIFAEYFRSSLAKVAM
jgi:thioesterase domain-containing protein